MSPPRRRSSRLAASTPKSKSTPELASVNEGDNVDQAPAAVQTPTAASKNDTPVQNEQAPVTPKSARPEPPTEEMHPSKWQHNMAPEPSSALRLGFTDVKKTGNMNNPGEAQGTPTRARPVPATEFTFRFSRGAADVPLSENAQRLMNELREHANQIKADMRAQRELDGDEIGERKIAQPKGKASRFSAAHMAEFKKMDSIENHASAWRANRTPDAAKTGLKRSPSKAELDGTPTSVKSPLKRSPSKAELDGTPTAVRSGLKKSPSKVELGGTSTPTKAGLKRSISKANLDSTPSPVKSSLKRSSSRAKLDDGESTQPENVNFSVSGRPRTTPKDEPQSTFAKRIKKFQDDDASKSRPISRDGSTIPRPKSSASGTPSHSASFSRLTSPTKSSIGHSATPIKPTITMVNSPSKSELGSLKRSASSSKVSSPSPSKTADSLRRRIISPARFQKVKSILRGPKAEAEPARTALPKPASQVSQTPGPSRTVDKELPPLPLTTPRRKLVKHVAFTPDTKHAAETQNSPSPQKFGQPKAVHQPVEYPTLDGVLADVTAETNAAMEDVKYPDLSGLKDPTSSNKDRKALPHSVPGTFSFRSDHTINFGAPPAAGFGASPGQASLRQVRTSLAPKSKMPGSFPAPPSPSEHPNKENKEPAPTKTLSTIAHGMSNKKRHRASSEEDDVEREAADRAAKKRKNDNVPTKKTPTTTRTVNSTPMSSVKKMQTGRTPVKAPSSVSPVKKKGGLSLSRLQALARPKNRA